MIKEDFYVYTYSYPDGGLPFYVGKGCGERDTKHLRSARCASESKSFNIRTILKLLRNNQEPVITRIVENVDEELALFIEEEFITKYGRRDLGTGVLTNLTNGGDGVSGFVRSEESKAKHSKSTTGTNHHFYGKKMKVETKAKISKSHIGMKPSLITRAKLSVSAKARGYSQSKIEAMRKVNTGCKRTEEYKQNMSEARKGIPQPKVECPHCKLVGGISGMKHWHFDNCKENKLWQ